MAEFNFKPEMISEDDLLEAANKIFNAQEQDFEKIKSEKWYQTLFHAITLNRDGQKYAVRGMSSLAKLQQLFMNIYVKNYKETNEQLNIIIDAIIQDKNAIKELYMRISGLEKRKGLNDLEPQEADLLVLFLREYVDEDEKAPERIREYNSAVINALRRNGPIGKYKVTLDKLGELKSPAAEVFYRCFMEQCAIDGTIDSKDWPDNINPLLDDLVLSTNQKNEIKSEVKHESQTTAEDNFIKKYTEGYDTDEMFTDEDFEIEFDEIEDSVFGEDKDDSSNDDEPINVDQEDVYLGEREDEYIDNILQIPAGTVKRYVNKNIHISAYISCAGTLEFDNCCIYYNESNNADEIAMEEKAKLSIVNSAVICAGLDKMPFISGRNGFDISFEATKFSDCSYFLEAYCNSFRMIGCTVENCFCDFININVDEICEIKDNMFSNNKPKLFNLKNADMTEIDIWTDEKVQGCFENNVFIEADTFKFACSYNTKSSVDYLKFRSIIPVTKCTFSGISEAVRTNSIKNCYFENCGHGVWVGGREKTSLIENCTFNHCTEVIIANENSKILNCQFVSCYGRLISSGYRGGITIEFCEFTNIKMVPGNENYYRASISLRKGKGDNVNYVRKCIFNGVDIGVDKYLIEGNIVEKISGFVAYIEKCNFTNCYTVRQDGEIIKRGDHYYPRFSNHAKNLQTIEVLNCKGLDKVILTAQTHEENVNVKMVDGSGCPIGSTLQF